MNVFEKLKSQGDLTTEQIDILNDVQTALVKIGLDGKKEKKKKKGKRKEIEKENSPTVNEKITVIENNLNIIIDHLKSAKTAHNGFMKYYPEWSEKREKNIGKLREVAEELDSDRFNCNVSRLASYATSFVGGGLVLTSAILAPITAGLSAPFGIAGGVLIAAGSSTSLGTAATELCRMKSKVDKAQVIVEEDKALFEILSRWMEHANALDEAQTNILDIDIVKDLYSDIKKLVNEAVEIKNAHKRLKYLEKEIKKIITCSKKSMQITVIGIKTLVYLLIGIHMIISNAECRQLFDCASLTVKLITTAAIVLADQFTNITNVLISVHAISKVVAKAAAHGTFAAVGMILDVAGIISISKDIHKGSFSSQARKIFSVANEMEKEAEVLQKVYEDLVEKQREKDEKRKVKKKRWRKFFCLT